MNRVIAFIVIMTVMVSALIAVNVDRADAIAATCPVSATVFQDGDECFRKVQRPTSGNCADGTTPDASSGMCREPFPKVQETITQEPSCPEGFAVTESLAGICSRTDPALQSDAACPLGSRGVSGSCYVVSALYECIEGLLSGDSCTVEVGRPLNRRSTCPVSDQVMLDGTECFVLVPKDVDGNCPAFATDGPEATCRRPVDLRPGEKYCEEGALISGRCVLVSPALQIPCGPGQGDQFGLCREPVADRTATPHCVGAAQVVEDDHCVGTMAANATGDLTLCPDGFVVHSEASGTCVFTEPAVELAPDCPDGARGIEGACYILVAKGSAQEAGCVLGELEGANCVELGNPPTFTDVGPTCNAGFTLVGVMCLRFSEPEYVDARCPSGSSERLDGSCRKPVASARGARVCANPSASLVEETCLLIIESVVVQDGSACPEGYVFDGVETCRITESPQQTDPACRDGSFGSASGCIFFRRPAILPGAVCTQGTASRFSPDCKITGNAVTTRFECPISATVLEEDGVCYTLIYRATSSDGSPVDCPNTTTPDPDGIQCRRPVQRREVAASCDPSFVLSRASCVRYVSPEPASAVCSTTAPEAADNVCWLQTSEATGGYYCEDPTAAINPWWEANRSCTTTADFSRTCTGEEALAGECGRPSPACPDGYSADDSLGGLCARFEPALLDAEGNDVCPDPASALARFGSLCVFTTEFVAPCDPANDACAFRTVLVCPVSETVMIDGDECFKITGFACPLGTTPDVDPTKCRQAVALVAPFVAHGRPTWDTTVDGYAIAENGASHGVLAAVKADGHLYTRRTSPNGVLGGWVRLGIGGWASADVAIDEVGRVEFVGVKTDGRLYTRSWGPSGVFSPWTRHGAPTWSADSQPSVATNGSTIIFAATKADGRLYTRERTVVSNWGGFEKHGLSGWTQVDIAMVSNGDAWFAATKTDGRLYVRKRLGDSWSGFAAQGRPTWSPATPPSISARNNGVVFAAVKTDGTLYTRQQVGGRWHGFVAHGAGSWSSTAVDMNATGDIALAAVKNSGALYTHMYDTTWGPWTRHGRNTWSTQASPAVAIGSSGAKLLAAKAAGQLYTRNFS